MALLGGPFILFEFEDAVEVERVLHSGVKWFKGKCLLLDWWNPSVRCLIEDRKSREVWVRILGLPLHLWGMSLCKNLGEACSRFVGVDEDTVERRNLQWARVLVGVRGWNFPSSLQVVVGSTCFVVQLWWETTPSISKVQPSWCCRGSRAKDEGEVGSRALRHAPSREWLKFALGKGMTMCRWLTRCSLQKRERTLFLM